MRDEHEKVLGYVSMDSMERPPAAELWCAHIANLEYGPKTYLLVYCLLLMATADVSSTYKRVGVAEVKYEWICQAPTVTISVNQ